MAILLPCLIFLTIFLHFVSAQQDNGRGSVRVGASLTAADDVNPWLSPSGDFAFGFQRIQGQDNFVLSIWYDKIPGKTIIWYPETNATLSPGSKVELSNRRGLVLNDRQGREAWTSGTISSLAYGFMNDTGNFVLVGSDSRNIWESFNSPADTILPTQVMERGGVINSKISETNFSRGRFQLRLLEDGNLVLNTIDIFSGSAGDAYYISGTYDASNSSNSGDQLIFSEMGYMYILRRNGERSNQCWKKKLPLSSGRIDTSLNVKVFLKFRKGDSPTQSPRWFSEENKNQKNLILVGSALLGTSVFVIGVLIVVICVGFFQIYKKKSVNPYPSRKSVETNLPRFTYQELVKATDGFKNELGKGAFGIVYKGEIETKIVAVKKLFAAQDSQKEFKTEVGTIARTHHKNLVQLVGYCDDGEERLLVYEYMSNSTLAVFLFGNVRPCWKQRTYIALGIAKGLSYLHEECRTQIIHCDIKPENILLDEYYNAKIADFGLAKLLMINESRTNTGIRGTKGYVAPEWFRNTPVTVKVDVYSFGVLFLEIISCRKCVVFESANEDAEVLTDLAWDCYQEGRLEALVENDLEALDDFEKLTTFVRVGLWCVQENPSLRPSMRKVIQMLEGGIEVTEPPCPCPFSVTSY